MAIPKFYDLHDATNIPSSHEASRIEARGILLWCKRDTIDARGVVSYLPSLISTFFARLLDMMANARKTSIIHMRRYIQGVILLLVQSYMVSVCPASTEKRLHRHLQNN